MTSASMGTGRLFSTVWLQMRHSVGPLGAGQCCPAQHLPVYVDSPQSHQAQVAWASPPSCAGPSWDPGAPCLSYVQPGRHHADTRGSGHGPRRGQLAQSEWAICNSRAGGGVGCG